MLIDTLEQNLESAINNTYQKVNSEDPVTVISLMITDKVHHNCHYSMSNYSLENGRLYYYGKL